MNERLHPLTLGEVLDRTAHLYRSHFLAFVGIAVIPVGTVVLSAGALLAFVAWAGSLAAKSPKPGGLDGPVIALMVAMVLIAMPLWFGVSALSWAAMSQAATRAFLGEPFTIRDTYKCAWGLKGRYVGLCLLMVLLVGVVPAAAFLLLMLLSAGGAAAGKAAGMGAAAGGLAGVAVVLAFVGAAVYVLWMVLRVCLAFPVCVVEQIGAWNAVKRATALSIGTKWRIVVMFLLGFALTWVLAMGLMIPMTIAIALIPGATTAQHAQIVSVALAIAWYVLSFGVQVLTKPIYGIALAVFYFDQRIRNEGFDIEWMMRQAGMGQETVSKEAILWLPGATGSLPPNASGNDGPVGGQFDPETPQAGGLA
jgi:hypothetical protein